jgi:hypothetical protein
MAIRHFYLFMAVLGTILPWILFAHFFRANGADIPGFVMALFPNGAAGGFSTDVLLSIIVFWLWSWRDAGERGVARWWLVLPASFLVGLSLALPLYLYLREDTNSPPGL